MAIVPLKPMNQGKLTRTDRISKSVPQVRMQRGAGMNMGDTEGLHPRPKSVTPAPASARSLTDTIPSMNPSASTPTAPSMPAFKKGGMVGKSKQLSCKTY